MGCLVDLIDQNNESIHGTQTKNRVQPISSAKNKMPPPKSKVWQYFKKNIDGAECNLCAKKVISKGGNTTNLAVHLRRAHKIECSPHPSVAGLLLKVVPKQHEPVVEQVETPVSHIEAVPPLPKLPESSEKNTTVPLSKNDEVTVASQNTESRPLSIWERARMVKLDTTKQQQITRAVAVYLVKDMRPFSTVQSVNFRNMIHTIDPRVVIPNSDTFSQRIIPSWYNIEVTKLTEELHSTKHVSLTADCWTSRMTIPFMTVTAHFLNNNFELQSKVLQTRVLDERHTGENISVALNSALKSWQIDQKVCAITTDNASNMGRAVEISDINLQIGCFAHTLDLAAKKAVEVAKPLSKYMKPVISFLHRSHIGAKVLREKQEALNVPKHRLITDVETRWNSTYLMYERYFEQRVAIHATFMDKQLETHKSVYRDFKDSEVVKAEEFLEFLKPFYEMTLAVCSEKNPTASLILPLCEKVLKKCEPSDGDSDFTLQLKRAIGNSLSKRYTDKSVRDFLLKCTALDPRMKFKSVVDEQCWKMLSDEIVDLLEMEEEMERDVVRVKKEEGEESETEVHVLSPPKKTKTLSLMETFLSDDDDDEMTITAVYKPSHQEIAAEELKTYREMPKHVNASNPLTFYQLNRFRLPRLSVLASKYLVAQATSVASERVFSTSGDILSAERSCLDDGALDAMIFLKKNAQTADFIF